MTNRGASSMMYFKSLLLKRKVSRDLKAIQEGLALHHRGEVRGDGLTLTQASHHLEIEWRARDIHPWDRASGSGEREFLFAEQAIADTDAALSRLFNELPEVDVIKFRVTQPDSDQRIFAGTVERSGRVPSTQGVSARTRLWHRGVTTTILVIVALVLGLGAWSAQSQTIATGPEADTSSTSTDLFVMIGSDFDRPGLLPQKRPYRRRTHLRLYLRERWNPRLPSHCLWRTHGIRRSYEELFAT
jgi:hypothetical protein